MATDPLTLRFDHLGLVVAELAQGRAYLQQSLGIERFSPQYQDPLQKVWVQFGWDTQGLCYELVAPSEEGSPVANALAKRSNILNHLAYRVRDIAAGAEHLRQQRHLPLGPAQPAVAFAGARVQFFLSPLGHIVELVEELMA